MRQRSGLMRIAIFLVLSLIGCGSPNPAVDAGDDDADLSVDSSMSFDAGPAAMHGSGFDAYEGQVARAVVWDGTTDTILGTVSSESLVPNVNDGPMLACQWLCLTAA
jgi:hypothetical protein